MLHFDERPLKMELDKLPARSRVAFCVSCAQRLVSPFRASAGAAAQTGRADLVDRAITYLWTHILAAPEKDTAGRLLSSVVASIPDEDAPGWTPATVYAEDALSAVAYCLRCMLSGDSREAVWAARRVYEAAGEYTIVGDNVSISLIEPTAGARVVGDAAMQAELERQSRDLALLQSAGDRLATESLGLLRLHSAAEPAIVEYSGPV